MAQDGHALRFASEGLRADAQVVAAAVQQNRTALAHAIIPNASTGGVGGGGDGGVSMVGGESRLSLGSAVEKVGLGGASLEDSWAHIEYTAVHCIGKERLLEACVVGARVFFLSIVASSLDFDLLCACD